MASRLYDYCKMRWTSGAWGPEQMSTAVTKGYITQAESDEIMALPQTGYSVATI
jgi:hypothetical protein